MELTPLYADSAADGNEARAVVARDAASNGVFTAKQARLKGSFWLDAVQDGDEVALRRYPRRNAASRRQTSRREASHSREALRRDRAQRLQRRHRSALHAQAAHAEGAATKGRPLKAYSWLQAGLSSSLRWTSICPPPE